MRAAKKEREMGKRQLFSTVTAIAILLGQAGFALANEAGANDLLLKLSQKGTSLDVGNEISAYHIRFREVGNQADRGGTLLAYKHDETKGVVVQVNEDKSVTAKFDQAIPTNEKIYIDIH